MPQLSPDIMLILKWLTATFGSGVTGTVNLFLSVILAIFIFLRFGGSIREYNRKKNEERRNQAQAQNPIENHQSESHQTQAEDSIEDIIKRGQ